MVSSTWRRRDDNAVRRRWLEEFPGLANSELGRGMRDTTLRSGGRGGARTARLIDFYASELFAGMATAKRARLAELRPRWRSD
jgi:hypothetical protein